jgi:hypothetical protein
MNHKYKCEKCVFFTQNKKKYEMHLQTNKHKNVVDEDKKHFNCPNCKKVCNTREALWYHKKKCDNKNNITIENENKTHEEKDIIKKEMQEMQEKIVFLENIVMQYIKKEQPIQEIKTINNNVSNSNNNNTNNINIFLNEKCKDAINIKDFIQSLFVDMNDFLKIENNGYILGMSEIIQEKLNSHSIYKRPIHYESISDKKDNAIHIKHNDKWNTETDRKKPLLTKAMQRIDEKVFEEFRKVKEALQEKHPNVEKNLMMGSYEDIRAEVGKNVLKKLKIDELTS